MKIKISPILLCVAASFACLSISVKANETIYDGNGNELVWMDRFDVNSSDPDTFDWEGYYQWLWANYGSTEEEAPDPFDKPGYGSGDDGGGGDGGSNNNANTPPSGQLGTRTTNNTFPYAQSTNTSCGVNAARNIINILKGACARSEVEIAQRMADAINGIGLKAFRETDALILKMSKDYGVTAPKPQFSAALNPEGITVGDRMSYDGYSEFLNMMSRAAINGSVIIVETSKNPQVNLTNHVVVMHPRLDECSNLFLDVIDSGYSVNGQAKITTYNLYDPGDLENAANVPTGRPNPTTNEPMSGNLYSVFLTPTPPAP